MTAKWTKDQDFAAEAVTTGKEDFMAIFDWNGDGKKDIWDTAIEYEIYKQMFPDDEEKDDYDSDDDDF